MKEKRLDNGFYPSEMKKLKEAVRILKKHFRSIDKGCKEYGYQCIGCNLRRTVEELDSLVNFYL